MKKIDTNNTRTLSLDVVLRKIVFISESYDIMLVLQCPLVSSVGITSYTLLLSQLKLN